VTRRTSIIQNLFLCSGKRLICYDLLLLSKDSTDTIHAHFEHYRMLVSPDPTMSASIDLNTFKGDLKRARWLDDTTIDMGLVKYPSIGNEMRVLFTGLHY
jgi:hypothetical protein